VSESRYPTADAAIEEIRKMRASLEPRLSRVHRQADLTFVIVATGYFTVLGILAAVAWLP
jgi:aspartate/tyrosine/aromatic aminotransferase